MRLVITLSSALLLAGLMASSAAAAPLDEDIDFGAGLVERGFPDLGIEVLENRLDEIEDEGQRAKALNALLAAHREFAGAVHGHLSSAEADAKRARHQEYVDRYSAELEELDPSARVGTVAEFLRLRAQAEQYANRAAVASGDQRDQLLQRMSQAFERAIEGLERLTDVAAQALEEHEKQRPDDRAQLQEWLRILGELQGKHANAGYELNRTRFAYYQALPPRETERRNELLQKTIEHLEILCPEYGLRGETIIGQLTLSRAYLAAEDYRQAQRSAEMNLLLIEDAMESVPQLTDELRLWEHRTKAVRALAMANQDSEKIEEAIRYLDGIEMPEALIARGELILMLASRLREGGREERAEEAQERANTLLERLSEQHPQWEGQAISLRQRYGLDGMGPRAVMRQISEAHRARDNEALIRLIPQLLEFGDQITSEQRTTAFQLLAMAYRQENMFHEAFTVYRHIVSSGKGGEQEETYGRLARLMLRQQRDATGDEADELLYQWVRNWFLETFGGEPRMYEDALRHIASSEFEEAVASLAEIPEDSVYYEAAIVKTAEARMLWAQQLRNEAPQRSSSLLDQAKADFLRFMERAEQESIYSAVNRRRARLMPAAVYGLSRIYIWPGREDYEAYLELTENFVGRFPDAAVYHPAVSYYRVQALVRLELLDDAEDAYAQLERVVLEMDEERQPQGERLLRAADEARFRAHAANARTSRSEAQELEAQAEQAEEPAERRGLREQIQEKRDIASQSANRALDIVTAMINRNPEQPYETLYWAVGEFHRQDRLNEGLPFLELFLERFEGDPLLTRTQQVQLERARILLGTAYYHTGQYEEAYIELKEQYDRLDEIYNRRLQHDEDATPPPYWATTRLHLAKAAQQLAPGSDAYLNEALEHCTELLRRLTPYSEDWWDVVATIAELWNLDGRYSDNLRVIRRRAAGEPSLGGPEIRSRLASVVREVYNRSEPGEEQDRARALLVRIRAADARDEIESHNYGSALDAIERARELDPELAGGQETFIRFIDSVIERADEEQVRERARELKTKLQ